MEQRPARSARTRPSLAAALALAVVLPACSGGAGSTSSTTGPPVAAALPASPTALPTFAPGQFRQLLARLRGRAVVVNVWASWCGPCIVEAPGLASLARTYRGRAQFVGVDVQDDAGPARAFIRRYGWTYPSVFDPTGAIRTDLGFLGQPVTIVFDRSGRRVFTWSGAVSSGQLGGVLARLTGA